MTTRGERETNSLPTISVAIATFNSERTMQRCLESVRGQRYPQERVRLMIADGSSTDQTVAIARRFDAAVIVIPPDRQSAEYNKGVAVRAATGDLLLMIDHDNILPHPEWLRNMVRPFQDVPDLVAAQTLRYRYDPNTTALDRYCALFGTSDPVVYALGKCDRLPWFRGDHIPFGRAEDRGTYYLVQMDPERIPTLGANGCLVRRDLLFRYARIGVEDFYHIDVHVDLIQRGWRAYAFTKDDLLHLTAYKSLRSFLARRKLFMEQFSVTMKDRRRYHMIAGSRDRWRLALFSLSALTILKPTLDALKGFLVIRDRAWFLHPVLSFSLLWIYASVVLMNMGKRYAAGILRR